VQTGNGLHGLLMLGIPVALARCYFGNHFILDTWVGLVQGYTSTQVLCLSLGGARGHGVGLVAAGVVLYFLSGFLQRVVLGLGKMPPRSRVQLATGPRP
jgi:membrane-associated phospholipid phosphatase